MGRGNQSLFYVICESFYSQRHIPTRIKAMEQSTKVLYNCIKPLTAVWKNTSVIATVLKFLPLTDMLKYVTQPLHVTLIITI